MSRRTFWQGRWEIVAGWDCPLGHFFLDIYDHTEPLADDEEERFIYSSLDEPPGLYERYSLDDVQANLEDLNVSPPATFYADLADDAQTNRGNYVMRYSDEEERHERPIP